MLLHLGGSLGVMHFFAVPKESTCFLSYIFLVFLESNKQFLNMKVIHHQLGQLKAEKIPVFTPGAYQILSRARDCDWYAL